MFELYGTYESVEEARDRLKLTESYIRRLLRQGKIAGAVKTGRDWLIPVTNNEDECMRLREGQELDIKRIADGRVVRLTYLGIEFDSLGIPQLRFAGNSGQITMGAESFAGFTVTVVR